MKTSEFSDEFDVLFNNITSSQAPGLNEYEKSVFLTKAQSQLVIDYFNPKTDGVGGGFDGSQKRQYDFSKLIKTADLVEVFKGEGNALGYNKLDSRSKVFLFPSDYFIAVNELLEDSKYQYSVLPKSYSEYQTLMLKPYSFPTKKGAWRLLTGTKDCFAYIDDSYNFVTSGVSNLKNFTLSLDSEEVGNIYSYIGATITKNMGNPYLGNYSAIGVKVTSTYCYIAITLGEEEFGFILKYSPNSNTAVFYLTFRHPEGFTYNLATELKVLKDAITIIKKIQDSEATLLSPSNYNYFNTILNYVSNFDAFNVDNSIIILDGQSNQVELSCTKKKAPVAEIIGNFSGKVSYSMRYIGTLKPILLTDLKSYNLTIDGYKAVTECELPKETHQEILERAVTLAKIAWQGGTYTQAQQAANAQQNTR